MNLQEIYEKAVSGVVRQGRLSFEMRDAEAYCRYRSPDGAACVIGQLIPDALYTPRIEGRVFNADWANPYPKLLVEEALCRPLTETETEFLSHLQRRHDDATDKGDLSSFLHEAAKLAASFNLIPYHPNPLATPRQRFETEGLPVPEEFV